MHLYFMHRKRNPTLSLKAVLILFWIIFAVATPSVAASQEQQYTMGAFPFMPVANIEALFGPLGKEIGKQLGKQLVLVSSGSFEKFSQQLERKAFHIAFVHPFDYVQVAKPAGYLPVAARSEHLASYFVVKEGSPIKSLSDLKGRVLGNPPEESTVSILNRITLKAEGLNGGRDVKMSYFKSHMACMQQLLIGSVDACGVSPAIVRLAEQQLQTRFLILYKSPVISAPLFVVRGNLPRKERESIRKALLATELKNVKPELRKIFMPDEAKKPFIPISDADYDNVRQLLRKRGH